jgi:PAS domain S-box-containing protein
MRLNQPAMGWFRVHLRVDPRLVRRPLVMNLNVHGTAEFYLDGELIHAAGHGITGLGKDAGIERSILPIPVTFSSTNAVLAVRYNLGSQVSIRNALTTPDFMHVTVGNSAALHGSAADWSRAAAVMMGMFGLFAAIAFLHLLMYGFLREPISNLYFGIFAILNGVYPLTQYFLYSTTDFRRSVGLNLLSTAILGPGLLALLAFLYAVFYDRRPRMFWVMAAAAAAWVLALLPIVPGWIASPILFSLLTLFALEGLRVVVVAVLRGKPGSRIIGAGFALTFAAWIYIAMEWFGWVPALGNLFVYGFLGVLLSSSVYLARTFALNTKGFRRLSLELADNNRSLEAKVAERTAALEQQMSVERHRASEQKALIETMADLSGQLELSKLLQSVLDRAVNLIGSIGGELAIVDDAKHELIVVANKHMSASSVGTRLTFGEGAMGHVVESREHMIIPDYQTWDGRSRQYSEVPSHALVVCPLLIGQRPVGAIAVWHEDPDKHFTEGDVRLLNMFAQQAAVAIENARLYTEAQEQRQYFESVVVNSPVAIVTLDLDQRIASANPAFERLFGWSQSEIIGKDLDSLITDEVSRQEAIDYTRRAASDTVHHVSRRLRKDGALVDVEVLAVPVFVNGERRGLVALYHDITELARARREAETADRAKSQFLANMSHELRTPLNAVIGYSEMLMEEAEDAGDHGYLPDLRKIHSSGRHLLGLINDILDLSKIESGRMELYFETFDIQPMIEEVATTIAPLVERNGNRLVLELAPDPGTVRLDQVKVRQILFNLLSNASKFTEHGTITLAVARSGEHLSFRVADSGIGMTSAQMARLFQPFTQADASTTKKYGGTGLGLAITRRFCEMMGGTIELESEQGRGTAFTVLLPCDADAFTAEQLAPAAEPVPGVSSTAASVLVIDDDAAARDMLSRMLGKEGYRVLFAASGEEGLRIAREEQPDVITLDVLMAGLDGWGALSRLKADAATADIPVVVVTVLDDRNLGFALGAADYLTKPIERERLADALRRVRADERAGPALVVDDDPGVREMLRRILEKDGWRVVEAENGRVALDCMLESGPSVVLLDLMMPEMDGFTFIDEVRRRGGVGSAPIIVLTAKTLTETDRQRLQGAVTRVLQKGEQSSSELIAEIRRVMQTTRRPAPAGGS